MQAFIFLPHHYSFFQVLRRKEKYTLEAEREGESHKAKMFINFFIKKVYYLKILKTRLIDRENFGV